MQTGHEYCKCGIVAKYCEYHKPVAPAPVQVARPSNGNMKEVIMVHARRTIQAAISGTPKAYGLVVALASDYDAIEVRIVDMRSDDFNYSVAAFTGQALHAQWGTPAFESMIVSEISAALRLLESSCH